MNDKDGEHPIMQRDGGHPHDDARDEGKRRGRRAVSPLDIPWRGYIDVFRRVGRAFSVDRVSANAAGAAFFMIFAIVPALAALVSLYGLVGDPSRLRDQLTDLDAFLPPAMLDLMDSELDRLIDQRPDTLGLTFATTFAIAIYVVNNAVLRLFDALNVIYGERETRSYFGLYGTSILFTIGALIFAAMLVNVVITIPIILRFLPLGPVAGWIITVLPLVVIFVVANIGIAVLYRYGPSRVPARWRWISPGSVSAATVWVATSAGFSFYMSNFADYSATYGSLGAIAAAMMWAYLSTLILLVGAEFNAELEQQTSRDTTIPPERKMGERGANVADTLGKTRS
ncbi:MAG: YihY/virulence factor BrkB family protein [Salinarimonas sp.]|nr:YihY/virulence factor BrkB family protein [Salinarimonas sp.]